MIFTSLVAVVACISWTVTKAEIAIEFRQWCERICNSHSNIVCRKIAYLPTCYYCFSHWVAIAVLLLTGYRLPYGFLVTLFTLVAAANVALTGFHLARGVLRLIQNAADILESLK